MCCGRLVAGGCNVATRWHCDGVEALRQADQQSGSRSGDASEYECGDASCGKPGDASGGRSGHAPSGDASGVRSGGGRFGGQPTTLMAGVGLSDLGGKWAQ